jgi:hypothetical protein
VRQRCAGDVLPSPNAGEAAVAMRGDGLEGYRPGLVLRFAGKELVVNASSKHSSSN